MLDASMLLHRRTVGEVRAAFEEEVVPAPGEVMVPETIYRIATGARNTSPRYRRFTVGDKLASRRLKSLNGSPVRTSLPIPSSQKGLRAPAT